jgi:hypothetical protein
MACKERCEGDMVERRVPGRFTPAAGASEMEAPSMRDRPAEHRTGHLAARLDSRWVQELATGSSPVLVVRLPNDGRLSARVLIIEPDPPDPLATR